jgi:hypothetical protein
MSYNITSGHIALHILTLENALCFGQSFSRYTSVTVLLHT